MQILVKVVDYLIEDDIFLIFIGFLNCLDYIEFISIVTEQFLKLP